MLKKLFSTPIPEKVILDGECFKIKHSHRRNMRRIILRIENKNELRLSSARVSKKQLLSFIQENKVWILEQHKNIKAAFLEDTSFYYLNKAYKIKHHNESLCLDTETVYLNPLRAKQHSDMFYRKCAKAYLPDRVDFWTKKMGLEYNRLSFRLAKKRWGSCNTKRNISLNPYMMKLSYEMIDYIIVHELSHLRHMNHSKVFYECVQNYIPDYINIEKEIKALSLKLN